MQRLPNDDHVQSGLSLRWLPRAVIAIAVAILLQGLVRIFSSHNPHNTQRAQIIESELLTPSASNLAAIEASLAQVFPGEQDAGSMLNNQTEKYLARAYELSVENSKQVSTSDIQDAEVPEALLRSFPGKRGTAVLQLFDCYRAYKNAESRAAMAHLAEINRGNVVLDYRPLQHYFFAPELTGKLFSDYEVMYASLSTQADVHLIAIKPEHGNTPHPHSCDQIKQNEIF